MTPDVTVVVICFNDAKRLRRAVASVQRQTLGNLEIVIVDDASTDDTEQVARSIAESDPRVRYERLSENSGGCSAPRNRGLEVARAPWVMFCDSDDEYERHAAKNLLLAAERTGADLVCGTAVRVDVRSGRTKRWRPELHDAEHVVDALADLPELLYDTISVNKIYRRSLLESAGLRFPEGILFEDQLFTLQAMASASRLAVIPETVYYWFVDKLGDDLSITQRRKEMRNVDSRIAVNRLIDGYLEDRGLADLATVKAEKFLRHDLYLYLSSMVEADDETAALLVEHLVPYVEQSALDAAWRLRPALRVAIFHLLRRDVDGVRRAMRFLTWASAVDATVALRDGREIWDADVVDPDEHVAGRAATDWLDVTDVGLLRVPFVQRRWLHRIDELTVDAASGRLRVHGRTRDYDGTLRASDRLAVSLTLSGNRSASTVDARWDGTGPAGDPGWYGWSADDVPVVGVSTALEPDDRGTVSVAVSRGEATGVMAVRSERVSCPTLDLPFAGAVAAVGPDTLTLGPGDNGVVGWRPTTRSAARTGLAERRARRSRRPGAARWRTFVELVQRDWLRSAVVRLGWLLPRRRLVVLEGRAGRAFGGDVRALAQALASAEPGLHQVWTHRRLPDAVPPGAAGVERGTLRHAWLLARASVVIDEGEGLPGPSRRAVVVDVGPGTPVRRLGLDDPEVLVSRSTTAALRRAGRRSRLLLATSPAAAEVIGPALAHKREVVAVGIPQADPVLVARRADLDGLRGRLGLPSDRPVVVYTPVRRDTGPGGPGELLDVAEWAQRLGDRAYLVVCSPPGMPLEVPTRLRGSVREASAGESRLDLLGAADLAVADYGRDVGDAALLDLPLVLLWPDRAAFVDRAHGVYPGVTEAGPVTESTSALCDEVDRWLADPRTWDADHGARRRAWASTWCGPADGRAAERAAAAVLAAMHGTGGRPS